MLLSFRVENFRSIRDEQEFSMMRSLRIAAHAKNASLDRRNVSTIAAIYGNNASGKSNVVNALHFMARAVRNSHSSWEPDSGTAYDPFLLDADSARAPSRFEVEILNDDVRYQYGFKLDGNAILEEWLYAFPHGRRQTWFERARAGEDEWYFGKWMKGRNRVIADLTRPNSLFISTAAASKHDSTKPIYNWFSRRLRLANQENFDRRMRFTVHQVEAHASSMESINRLLKYADLGICDVKVHQPDLSPEDKAMVIKLARDMAANDGNDMSEATDEDLEKLLQRATTTLELQHICSGSGKTVGLSLANESLGTRSLLALGGPIAHALRNGDVLLVDEIDTSLHPHLVAELVGLFKSPLSNPKGAQIIFTSHDTSLLGNLLGDEPVLERDQVWFVQKDQSGCSVLYPLTDFHPRRLENLERGYLQGRYGAIPYVDSRLTESALSCNGGGE